MTTRSPGDNTKSIPFWKKNTKDTGEQEAPSEDVQHKFKVTVLEHCHGLLRNTLRQLDGTHKNEDGARLNLEILCRRLSKVRALMKERTTPTIKIGVYGPPKRGKSSLLNALLGVEILPTAHSPKSNTVIEIHSRLNHRASPWLVKVVDNDGYRDEHPLESPQEVHNLIEQRGTHDSKYPNRIPAKRIEVHGYFGRSELIREGVVLVDTPGAEAAFDEEQSPHLKEDSKRAVDMLGDTQIVLFVARADQIGAENERGFFEKYMKALRPLNIVNFLDKWNSAEEGESLPCRAVSNTYGFPLARTLSVSALWAYQSLENGEIKDVERWGKSGIPDLIERIQKELDELEPERAVTSALQDLETYIDELNKSKHGHFHPDRVELDNLRFVLKGKTDEWARKTAGELDVLSQKWFCK